MTTPQYPWSTTTSDDLPQGVIAPNKLATTLQDHSKGKYVDLASARFPSIAKGTSAGSPSNVGGPLGFITNVFSGVVSRVATADPATITKPDDIVDEAGGFFTGLPLISWLDDLFAMITGNGAGLTGLAATIAGFFSGKWGLVDNAKNAADAAAADAQGALAAAKAADRKVTALLQGGTRTVYTSNFTYVPSTNVFKITVILYGGGNPGANAGFGAPGGLPGGLIVAEIPVSSIPSGGVAVTIGGSGQPTTFGALLSSASLGGGQLQNSTLTALAASVFPGAGGASGVNAGGSAITSGQPGGSTALASGGAGGYNSPGQAGGSAAVTGQYLAGGAGGGGGTSSASFFGPVGNGGAGGFPGGAGGGAGRNSNETYTVGGFGAPGLCAITEYTAAA